MPEEVAFKQQNSRRFSIFDVAPPERSVSRRDERARAGTAMLQQQCWIWGRDVQRADGNLLVAYGFAKTAPPKHEWGSSCYTYALSPTATIRLWGFGVLHSDTRVGSIFMRRSGFEPRLATQGDLATMPIWAPEQIGRTRAPRLPADADTVLALLPPLLAWIGAYEQWIRDTYGLQYRRDSLRGWHEQPVEPEQLPARWWELAAGWRELLNQAPRA